MELYKIKSKFLETLANETGVELTGVDPYSEFEHAFYNWYNYISVCEYNSYSDFDETTKTLTILGFFDKINTLAEFCRTWVFSQFHHYILANYDYIEDYKKHITVNYYSNELLIKIYEKPFDEIFPNEEKFNYKVLKIGFTEFNQFSVHAEPDPIMMYRKPINNEETK